MKNICQFSFNITAWNIVCNKKISKEDWVKGEKYWYEKSNEWDDIIPTLTFLNPMKRRRLSDSARLFFEAVWPLSEQDKDLPIIYASLNGEINRSFILWENLLKEEDISPTSFSLSVHNAIIGQWSEIRQVKNEMNAITAQKDNLEIALLEAFLLLNEGIDKVLVTVVEHPPNKKYDVKPFVYPPFSYALAMIVEKGDNYSISLSSHPLYSKDRTNNALIWVKNHYLTQKLWQSSSSSGGTWQWEVK